MYSRCSENKGADQLCSYCTADLPLCFFATRIKKICFSHDAPHIISRDLRSFLTLKKNEKEVKQFLGKFPDGT